MLKHQHYDRLVVGGGFYGAILAIELTHAGHLVVLCEKEADLLQRASYVNQARIHNGYHYPRSLLTALRSRVNFPRFVDEFRSAIVSDFRNLYAVSRRFSKVSAQQFRGFMEHIGAPTERASLADRQLFDPDRVEEVFACVEYVFDAVKLRSIVHDRLEAVGTELALGTKVEKVEPDIRGLRVRYSGRHGENSVTAAEVINCTYSQINELLVNSGLPLIRLKHELTEMALIEPPEELYNVGITVMCGPFFSCLPFPPTGLHTLSHVRYTPHMSWEDGAGPYMSANELLDQAPKVTNFPHMVRSAAQFLPCLRRAIRRDSLWEVKTVLPKSEVDDSRPILFRHDHGLPGLTCIMGGKIDNVYDALEEYRQELTTA